MSRKDKIQNCLMKYYAKDIDKLLTIVVQVIEKNCDIRELVQGTKNEFLEIVAEQTSMMFVESQYDFLDEAALEICRRICEMADNPYKLKKQEKINLIAEALGEDAIFECFCITIGFDDDEIRRLLESYRCQEDYDILAIDKVYMKRKAYVDMIRQYALAAVHLYGVIHVKELESLIRQYEKKIWEEDGYIRLGGKYAHSIVFNPKHMCTAVLSNIIGNMIPGVCMTMDGLILHECFREQLEKEIEKMARFLRNKNTEITEEHLDEFFYKRATSYFRELYWESAENERYIPSRIEFLRYADASYREINIAEKRFVRYLERKYMKNFKKAANQGEMQAIDYIDYILDGIHEFIFDAELMEYGGSSEGCIQYVFAQLEKFDILMKDINQANEVVSYIIEIMNSTRIWRNCGHTPTEMLKKNIDSERSESIIPMMSYSTGTNKGVERKVTKISPNEPCPCGSGKKYKKCCKK
ncbi:YecA family protein [Tannockella kyphosi]|uniref:YecA family protein n=1 Tax=Tannockella kyphosi TaxID=2899121 RepID=UPI0020115BC4|nr:SEC-C metal-binding domain-containing protein [Tannockella kyphosi]